MSKTKAELEKQLKNLENKHHQVKNKLTIDMKSRVVKEKGMTCAHIADLELIGAKLFKDKYKIT